MKRTIILIGGVIILAALFWVVSFYWNRESSDNIIDLIDDSNGIGENTTDFPLDLPDSFSISIFAKDLDGARVIVQDSLGNFWVSQTKKGVVSLLIVEDGKVTEHNPIFRNLNNPHGLALDPQDPLRLYIAEEDKISRARLYTEGNMEKIADLPEGKGHFTRTIKFGPDGKLYVSIGSSCNVCNEDDEKRASIYRMDKDGSNFEEFASGLRNTVFFDWSYLDGRMWGADMGRDLLGDNLPPDEINIIKKGSHYGWPYCYGKQIHDNSFDSSNKEFCQTTEPSFIDLQAHSAPLGLAFVPEEDWPEEMWYDLLVSFHGSWNRTEPTGYKVVRLKLDEFGNYQGQEDFISGWLKDNGDVLGRPVDILIQPGGIMYLTDDKARVVYLIKYR